MEIGADIVVRGLVQGVGFRYFVLDCATRLNLRGYVRNDADGSVCIGVDGDRSTIEELVGVVKIGPGHAHVSDVEVRWRAFKLHTAGFEIR